jgi:pimeloyl-ACP methyl ester carboxylesterase
MTVQTFELRVDGNPEVSFTIPDPDLMTAKQVIGTYMEVQSRWQKFDQSFRAFRNRVKDIVAVDFPDGYRLPNGKTLRIERQEKVTDTGALIDYLRESGRQDLIEQTVNISRLRQECAIDPKLAEDIAQFVGETGVGTLVVRGRSVDGYDTANPDLDVDLAGPGGGIL